MFLARPVPLAARDGDPPARVEWIAAANAARKALAALTAQKPPDEIEPFIAAIPARSPFGPVRLFVKSLIIDDPAKARRFVDGVPQASPFGPLRLAAEATLPGEPAEVVGRLDEASPAQRAFALEWLGASANGPSMLARLLDAKRSGPGQLFAFLTRQATTLPAADVRNACFQSAATDPRPGRRHRSPPARPPRNSRPSRSVTITSKRSRPRSTRPKQCPASKTTPPR